jgi:SAM-dependent methyltransferase
MSDAFDDLSDAYEAMIDWDKRLANERPFYQGLCEQVGAKRVLDAACGTGHHAATFHSWDMSVEGADLSPNMIERCRRRWGESPTLRWTVRGFDRPVDRPGEFDVAICVGNSLALAGDMGVITTVLGHMLSAVRAGGAVVIHVLNLWRLPDGVCQWQKCQRSTLPQGESLIIKGVHRAGRMGYVDMLVTPLNEPSPKLRSECVPFIGLEAADLERMLGPAGSVEVFGNYQRQAYDPQKSPDLIVVARKHADHGARP